MRTNSSLRTLCALFGTALTAFAHGEIEAQAAPANPAAAKPPAAPAAPAASVAKTPAAPGAATSKAPAPASAAPAPPAASPPAPAAVVQALKAVRDAWNKPTAPFRMIGNIYYVGTDGLASYLITTPHGHFLLDTALPESSAQIEQNIQKLGFKLSDIKFLLNSHAHFDHSGGMAQLKKSTGGQVVASEGDKSALEGGFYLGSESEHSLDSVPVKVDRTVKDGENVSLGGVTLTANLTPGHTRGCTSWSMPVRDAGKTYKVLFFCSATVAANRLVGPPQYAGIVSDYEKTFSRSKAMKVDVMLSPHPEFFGMKEKQAKLGKSGLNPFVNPAEFGAFIAKAETDFRGQLAQQQQAAAPKNAQASSTPTPAAGPSRPNAAAPTGSSAAPKGAASAPAASSGAKPQTAARAH